MSAVSNVVMPASTNLSKSATADLPVVWSEALSPVSTAELPAPLHDPRDLQPGADLRPRDRRSVHEPGGEAPGLPSGSNPIVSNSAPGQKVSPFQGARPRRVRPRQAARGRTAAREGSHRTKTTRLGPRPARHRHSHLSPPSAPLARVVSYLSLFPLPPLPAMRMRKRLSGNVLNSLGSSAGVS